MKLVCAPEDYDFANDDSLKVILYGQASELGLGSAGASVRQTILRQRLLVAPLAWDLLSLALSVVAADLAGHREFSPDGWTREFDLKVAVNDSTFWNGQTRLIEEALAFLTTDRWRVSFVDGGSLPPQQPDPVLPDEDCIVLLSGGLDSLVGAVDLVASGRQPFAVSQIVRGDAQKQEEFAQRIGNGLRHLQLNHNAQVPDPEQPPSQRARSLTFLAYGVLAATTLACNQGGEPATLYVCENGFISINPPLTSARLGSLSTRTTHPYFLKLIQRIIDSAGLRVQIENPYQMKTKGEMLVDCSNQELLKSEAARSTSCGRFKRYGYKHCGRCLPCQIRRAAFLAWGVTDTTPYVYEDLGRDDPDYSGFDDVRSAAMAIAELQLEGLDGLLGMTLSSTALGDVSPLEDVVKRGLLELAALHKALGVK